MRQPCLKQKGVAARVAGDFAKGPLRDYFSHRATLSPTAAESIVLKTGS